jgi:hypothetical protein
MHPCRDAKGDFWMHRQTSLCIQTLVKSPAASRICRNASRPGCIGTSLDANPSAADSIERIQMSIFSIASRRVPMHPGLDAWGDVWMHREAWIHRETCPSAPGSGCIGRPAYASRLVPMHPESPYASRLCSSYASRFWMHRDASPYASRLLPQLR